MTLTITIIAAYVFGAICGMMIEKILAISNTIEVNKCTKSDLEKRTQAIHMRGGVIDQSACAQDNKSKNVEPRLSPVALGTELINTPRRIPIIDVGDTLGGSE